MRRIDRLPTDHADVIHDVAYDYYGERMATCSSDMSIKVWERGQCVGSWKAHDGSVWRLAWAHPEFGQVLASCSFDRAVHVWEDPPGGARGGTWPRRAVLQEARDSVTDIAFAPRHLGLRLGALSTDGKLRVYEALDVMNLSTWYKMRMTCALEVPRATAFAWGQHSAAPASLAVGFGDGRTAVKAYDESLRQWRDMAMLEEHRDSVHSVSWAQHVGRTSQFIATGGRDGVVRVHSLRMPTGPGTTAAGSWEAIGIARLSDHSQPVWKVDWNPTGTLLASSGDDGTVKVWQADATGIIITAISN
ncbi:WD40-repeat-containing domain protein [Pavlovales sp. CCMP2436]|nr:WD40-repeat-containing domain protein [Pavlovales sp. CCMP2436]